MYRTEAETEAAAHPDASQGEGDAQDKVDFSMPPLSRGQRLAKLAGLHSLVWLAAMSLFAAADSWSVLSGLGIAAFLALVTGALAGLTTATLVHEWFHYLGARSCGASYDIPDKRGLFVYDWDFGANTRAQFMRMSIAGSVGGALSIVLLWATVPADSWPRAAVLGGAFAGFAFGSAIEWPVLKRVRSGADPLAELSKINESVLIRSVVTALVIGVLALTLLAP